jgi:hypothetical protein
MIMVGWIQIRFGNADPDPGRHWAVPVLFAYIGSVTLVGNMHAMPTQCTLCNINLHFYGFEYTLVLTVRAHRHLHFMFLN